MATDLLVLYDVDGWAYHFRAQALARHAPADFRVRIASLDVLDGRPADYAASPEEVEQWRRFHGRRLQPSAAEMELHRALGPTPPDVVFVLCHHQARRVRRVLRERDWPTRIVVSWNNGWPRRREDFAVALGLADALIVNNRDYWDRAGRLPGTHPISNGIDLETFRLVRPVADRTPRVLWCGSEYHRHVKGYDDLILPLFARLQAAGIACDALLVDSRGPERLGRQAMVDWYNSGTVLVCASGSEGTPNTALEAAACGCTVVTTRVGNMPELIVDGVNGLFVERDLDSLERGVRRAVADHARLAARLHADIRSWHWPTRAPEFFRLFRAVLAEGRTGLDADGRPGRDVTVTA